jgi:O-methyltransferase
MKVIVFGAGAYGRQYIENCPKDEEIVAVCDNNWGNPIRGNALFGHRIVSPDEIPKMDFDRIVIALDHKSPTGLDNVFSMHHQLNALGIDDSKVLLMHNDNAGNEYANMEFKKPRVQFLYDFSKLVYKNNIQGAIAECGVCWGDYSYHLNCAFPDRKLYLFDTFEKFPENHIRLEENAYFKESLFAWNNNPNIILNSDIALLKCPYRGKGNVIVKKGMVPDTFADITEKQFAYVLLDMDLYVPTIASLCYFAPRMSNGGIIAVHDYFNFGGLFRYGGISKAVDEFLSINGSKITPIGDGSSIIIHINN